MNIHRPSRSVLRLVLWGGLFLSAAQALCAVPVTFQVDLSIQQALGDFDPSSGTVVVAGPFNGWSPTASPLANLPDNPNLYTGTVFIKTVSPGGSVPHKFVVNGGTWETGDNRSFILDDAAQTLPVEPFDRVGDLVDAGSGNWPPEKDQAE